MQNKIHTKHYSSGIMFKFTTYYWNIGLRRNCDWLFEKMPITVQEIKQICQLCVCVCD